MLDDPGAVGGRAGRGHHDVMTVTSALVSFAVIAGLLTIVPGLDTALVLRSALTHGRSAAFATAAGIGTGSLTWGAASAAGVSALLVASQTAFTALRIVGAGYLLWTGAGLWRRRAAPAEEALTGTGAVGAEGTVGADGGGPRGGSVLHAWRRGLLTNLLNPKVGVFYVVMIPQFLPAGTPHLLMGLLLAGVHVAEGTAWFAALILLAATFRRRLAGEAVRRGIDRVTGTVLIGFAVRLATSP